MKPPKAPTLLWGFTALGVVAPVPALSTPPAPTTESAATPASSAPATDRTFRVKYRSSANVYLDGGRAQGLRVGDILRITEGQTTLAELLVAFVAEGSASCEVVSETRPVQVGDEAVLASRHSGAVVVPPGTVDPPIEAEAATSSPAASVSAPSARTSRTSVRVRNVPWGRLRGAASIGYYRSSDRTESSLDFEQRTARVDLGVYDIAGQPLSFTLRARSRQDIRARTLSARTPQRERTDRLYEMALRYEPPSGRIGVEFGRVGIHRFVGIGYLDGGLARFRLRPGVQVGAFGGRVAEVDGLGPEGGGRKYGGFVQLAPGGRYAPRVYDAVLAFVREDFEGDVSREYLSLESRFGGGGRWSLFQRAELDMNRGWRKEATGKSTQLSNVSLSANMRFARSAWAFVSYDGRRNYRYYRNRLLPDEVFDDLLHQGLRAGLSFAKPNGFGARVGFGMSLKEEDPRHPELALANAYSFNGGLRHANLFHSGFSMGIDGSSFSNGYTDGGVISARIGKRFGARYVLDLSYGRSFYRVHQTGEERTTQWLRFVGRADLSRRVFVLGDFEYDAGDDLSGPRGFLEVGVLF